MKIARFFARPIFIERADGDPDGGMFNEAKVLPVSEVTAGVNLAL